MHPPTRRSIFVFETKSHCHALKYCFDKDSTQCRLEKAILAALMLTIVSITEYRYCNTLQSHRMHMSLSHMYTKLKEITLRKNKHQFSFTFTPNKAIILKILLCRIFNKKRICFAGCLNSVKISISDI